jgi:hypothetical protein
MILLGSNPNVPAVAAPKPLSGVKASTPQYLDFEEPVDSSILNIAIFERLGAQELINIVRHDLIAGQKIDYQPVRGISRSGFDFDPLTLVSLQGTSDTVFNNFSIPIENKIPYTQSEPVQLINNDIVVSVVNLEPDEQVEVQVITFGDLLDDTIYEEES